MFNFTSLIGPVTNLIGSHLNNKKEERQAKHKAKLAVIENNADWESKMADASSNSWKDEFWTIVLSVPIFMMPIFGTLLGSIIEKYEHPIRANWNKFEGST